MVGAVRRLAAAAALVLAAGAAPAQDEVPFVTTPDNVTLAMLQLAGVGAADHVVDLGSGDGRIVITAARRFGASGLGVEIVGDLVRKSRDNARIAGVAERVAFVEQDLFATDLQRATVVTMYLLPAVNLQLRPRLLALAPGTRVVSHDWDMGDWLPDRSVQLAVPDKVVGREKLSRVHLWVVPAQVQGLWCSAGASLVLTQRFQRFSATLTAADNPATPVRVWDGRVDGTALHENGAQAAPGGAGTGASTTASIMVLPAGLRLKGADGPAWPFAGRTFTRAVDGACR